MSVLDIKCVATECHRSTFYLIYLADFRRKVFPNVYLSCLDPATVDAVRVVSQPKIAGDQSPFRLREADNMAHVEYNFLGSCGLKVSNICLGTMTFGAHPVSMHHRIS